ncbi:hypothetical protein PAPYR_2287 [Paratrimastix pyriformis]|uniref:Uncharacterized protein n=1 Tax=Paratrimastix pyriformis TaxID=342808 RepID=A0ABQ8UUN0_9EUKA|nr:hypothetical protein PAPYR_2287 [Paratrimastix pyriformis]
MNFTHPALIRRNPIVSTEGITYQPKSVTQSDFVPPVGIDPSKPCYADVHECPKDLLFTHGEPTQPKTSLVSMKTLCERSIRPEQAIAVDPSVLGDQLGTSTRSLRPQPQMQAPLETEFSVTSRTYGATRSRSIDPPEHHSTKGTFTRALNANFHNTDLRGGFQLKVSPFAPK